MFVGDFRVIDNFRYSRTVFAKVMLKEKGSSFLTNSVLSLWQDADWKQTRWFQL